MFIPFSSFSFVFFFLFSFRPACRNSFPVVPPKIEGTFAKELVQIAKPLKTHTISAAATNIDDNCHVHLAIVYVCIRVYVVCAVYVFKTFPGKMCA